MPIKIPNNLPATNILESENIFVMDTDRAYKQDIRPLKILIVNLMPVKSITETQLLRLLGNSPIQVEVDFIYTESYVPQHTSQDYLTEFYGTFAEVRHKKYDGLIITGAPVKLWNGVNHMHILHFISVGEHKPVFIIIMESKSMQFHRKFSVYINII